MSHRRLQTTRGGPLGQLVQVRVNTTGGADHILCVIVATRPKRGTT